MLKKVLPITLLGVMLGGCSSDSQQGFPTVSDSEVTRYILDSNKIEQCLYPQIAIMRTQANVEQFYQSLPLNEVAFLHYSSEDVLKRVIGEENFYRIERNSRAKQHFDAQFLRLNHSKPIQVETTQCQKVKEEQKQFLSQYRSQI